MKTVVKTLQLTEADLHQLYLELSEEQFMRRAKHLASLNHDPLFVEGQEAIELLQETLKKAPNEEWALRRDQLLRRVAHILTL